MKNLKKKKTLSQNLSLIPALNCFIESLDATGRTTLPLALSISDTMIKKLYDPSEQVVAFKQFYVDLAMPKTEPHFDQEYSDEIAVEYEHIKILCQETRTDA